MFFKFYEALKFNMRVTGNILKRGKPGKWLTVEQNGYTIGTNDYKCRLLYGRFCNQGRYSISWQILKHF